MNQKVKKFFEHLQISPEGIPTILGFFFIYCGSIALIPFYSWFFLALLGFVIYTFRNPKRSVIDVDNAIYSPADGRIVDIEKGGWDSVGLKEYIRIGIYLSLFNVHVQRIPYSGRVKQILHNKGKKYPAFQRKASLENEANIVFVETNKGIIITRQIAGMITSMLLS